jgi:cysteine desulfurase family protein (TIGR01976 family)
MALAEKAAGDHGVAGVTEIRDHFPALGRRVGGVPVAYFDAPGGTQVPAVVAASVRDYLLDHNANTHWAFATSRETDEILLSARRAMADYLGGEPREIVFGANMTTLTFHVGRALGRGLGPGDEIVVTELDHHANVDPWRALERERGVTIRNVRMIPETGQLDDEDLDRAINQRTRLVALGAASNALGTINDVRRAAARARSVGALLFVDAVHHAAHGPLDVASWDCDLLACSAYKFYGPHVGILWGRRDVLERLDAPKLAAASDDAPERLETGTQDHEGIAGVAAAVDFLASLAGGGGDRRERLLRVGRGLHERGRALLARLWQGLTEIPGVRLYGPPPDAPRTPTLSFSVDGRPARSVAEALAEKGVFVSDGDFYATTVVRRLGREKDGLVRAGCAAYTTTEEVDRLLAGVRALCLR